MTTAKAKPRRTAQSKKVAAPVQEQKVQADNTPAVPLFLGVILEEKSGIEVYPLQSIEIADKVMADYRATGEVIMQNGPRSRTILNPFGVLTLAQLDGYAYQPAAEEAAIVPSEDPQPEGVDASVEETAE